MTRDWLIRRNKGDEVLLNDGRLALQILTCGERAEAVVTRGGTLTSHKSIKVTGLMQPFVQNGSDLAYVRQVLKENCAENVRRY